MCTFYCNFTLYKQAADIVVFSILYMNMYIIIILLAKLLRTAYL